MHEYIMVHSMTNDRVTTITCSGVGKPTFYRVWINNYIPFGAAVLNWQIRRFSDPIYGDGSNRVFPCWKYNF